MSWRFPIALVACLAPPSTLLFTSGVVHAQTATPVDEGARASGEENSAREPRWHDSAISWENSLTTETAGVGPDPQTRNPTFETGLAIRPRYYLHETQEASLSARGALGVFRELTDSDTTTQRGELSVSDTDLGLVYVRRLLAARGTGATLGELRLPQLQLPTSQASFASGRYFAVGTLVALNQVSPLLEGRVEPDLLATLRVAAGYSHWFARATVPTSDELERVRMLPDGRSVPADQLRGASLIQHQLTFSARISLALGETLAWTTDAALAPGWKYPLDERVELCGVVDTGCATIDSDPSGTRYVVSTQFSTELSIKLLPALSLGFGYVNASQQLGADGRRRSFFHSPDARLYAALTFVPHELVSQPRSESASSAQSPARF